MKILCLLIVLIGSAHAQQQFTSVTDVLQLPQLSLLSALLKDISLFRRLQDPNFTGTVFAPVNAGLRPLLDAVSGDLKTVFGDSQHVADLFSTAVIPGQQLQLDQLQDGLTLSTLNGHTVTVSVTKTSSGPAVLVNNAQITVADIPAGKAIVHLVRPLVAPPEYADALDALLGFSAASTTPTAVWSPSSSNAVVGGGSAGTVPAAQSAEAMESAAYGPSSSTVGGMPAAYADGSPGQAALGPSSSSSNGAVSTSPAFYAAEDDNAVVNYDFEQDFQLAEQAASAAHSGASAADLLAESGQGNSTPTPSARNGVQQHQRSLGWWLPVICCWLVVFVAWAA